jgi:small conductance mechanosensitive channel
MSLESVREFSNEYLVPIGLRIVIALIVFVVGRIIARAIVRWIGRAMDRSQVDVSLRKFLTDVGYAILLVAVIIASLDTIGIKTTAIVAVLGAAGLAVGLALQGSLSNFAAGVMLIILRPYKIADLVMIGKYLGRVDAIRVFHTVLITADSREIILPNGQIITGPIENLTTLGRRRVDLVVSVANNPPAELYKVKQLLEGVVLGDKRVHQSPPATIDVAEITADNIKLNLRPWTSSDDYYAVAAETMERIKDTLEGAGIKYAVMLQPPA